MEITALVYTEESIEYCSLVEDSLQHSQIIKSLKHGITEWVHELANWLGLSIMFV